MSKSSVHNIIIAIISFLPVLTFAQTGYIGSFLFQIKGLLNQAVVFLIAFAVCWFIWNLIKYSFTSSSEEEKGKAKEQMVNGIIAIAVMVSIWGIINILYFVFGVDRTSGPMGSSLEVIIPSIPGTP